MPGPWKPIYMQGKSTAMEEQLCPSYINLGSGVWQISVQGLFFFVPREKQAVFGIFSKNVVGDLWFEGELRRARQPVPLTYVEVLQSDGPSYTTVPERPIEINNVNGDKIQISVVDIRGQELNFDCGIFLMLRRLS